MILVTVGTQLPFDRLMRMFDEIAPELGGEEIVAQSCRGSYIPRHFSTERFIEPERFEQLMNQARVVVAHAGIGTILSAMKRGKPLVVVARREDLGEHRNDHQIATARYLADSASVAVAADAESLRRLIAEAPVPNPLPDRPARSLVRAAAAALGL
ncbi:MAG: glycosyl transferase family 28 [Muribaculaceae bacterium]|nr:glycosyl transferase family 28 [Muribaculaceae bacterium]